MVQSNYKIAVIIVFFGEWPEWIRYFLVSVCKNNLIEYLIFSDIQLKGYVPNNVKQRRFSPGDFCSLVKEKLGITLLMDNTYKVCDYKPTYGKVFESYLKDFDYWAYSDIDLFYGDMAASPIFPLLGKYDIISGFSGFASGPFCMFRNISRVNNLYCGIKNYKTILGSPEYHGFDEHIVKKENEGISLLKIILLIRFLAGSISNVRKFLFNIKLFKYEFQWYVKKKTIDVPVDFTEAIESRSKKGAVSSCFFDFVLNDSDLLRMNDRKWRVVYADGKLIHSKTNKEISIFHFREAKNYKNFMIEKPGKDIDCFSITPGGIEYGRE